MVILVMGTTGSGKTTVGELLARRLGWLFLDGDDFHSAANKEKMHHGIPLTDADRAPWLAAIHDELLKQNQLRRNVVLACSALKQEYRDELHAQLPMQVIYLKGSEAVLRAHIEGRHGHFAGESLLPSQLATLEEPKDALVVDVSHTPEEIVAEVCAGLHLG
ncbi:MAG TPA: gluconokinase [Candidatus Acidoferrum sp.]|nr:gluconokinase [Candidatus Acidoferrum sp.]